MSAEGNSFDTALMQANAEALAENSYPGRGIILGISADGQQAMEAYWVMGRSGNSRNRILVRQRDVVKTEAFDPSKMVDPSLVIYNAMKKDVISHPTDDALNTHLFIVSNGDQTDTVKELTSSPFGRNWEDSFRNALLEREFEPDSPNFTPRVTGMLAMRTALPNARYYYSIIKRNPATDRPEHSFGQGVLEEDMPNGAGICFHTYKGDGEPLPPFEGSPYSMPLEATADETAEALWDNLDSTNRVALAVKAINKKTGEVTVSIVNQLAA